MENLNSLPGATDPAATASARFLDAAVGGQELPQLFSLFVSELVELVCAPQAIALLLEENGQLQVAAVYGYADRAEATRALRLPGIEEFAWQVIQARDSIGQTLMPGESSHPLDAHHMLGLPLIYAGNVLGVTLVQGTCPPTEMPPPVVEAAKRLSQQVSVVAELARVRELADRRNPADRVTGLLARSHFFERADREFRRSWRFGEPIGAVELDVDDFSRIQLHLGLAGGDDVMQRIARSVRPCLRSIDIIGRLNQDTLGILVLRATRETVLSVAERLRRAVAEIELATPDGPWQVTASIGVALYPREQCASVHDLYGLAAEATRAAKRAGRNRVVGV